MSSPVSWDRQFESHADFYSFAYGPSVVRQITISSASASLIEAHHVAGDCSDAPSPDLIFGWTSSSVRFSCDLGAGRFDAGDRPTDVILTAPGAGSSIQAEGDNVCRVLAIPYSRLTGLVDGGLEILPHDGDFARLHAAPLRDPRLNVLLKAIWHEGAERSRYETLATDGLLLQMAALLLRLRDDASRRGKTSKGGLPSILLKRVVDYLDEHLADDISLSDLSDLTGLSTFHVCRAFSASTGLPPHRWRYRRRVERAMELLERTTLSVTEISGIVGYDDPSQLSEAFKKTLGISPTQYRKQL